MDQIHWIANIPEDLTFATYARARRLEQGIEAQEVSRALGLSKAFFSDLEHGRRNPPGYRVARAWARVLGESEGIFEYLAAPEDKRALMRRVEELEALCGSTSS